MKKCYGVFSKKFRYFRLWNVLGGNSLLESASTLELCACIWGGSEPDWTRGWHKFCQMTNTIINCMNNKGKDHFFTRLKLLCDSLFMTYDYKLVMLTSFIKWDDPSLMSFFGCHDVTAFSIYSEEGLLWVPIHAKVSPPVIDVETSFPMPAMRYGSI